MYKVGTRFWNKEIKNKYEFLINSQYWSMEDLLRHQLLKLKEIVNVAYKNSAYYKFIYDSSKFHPEMIQSLSDIRLIPKISKKELLENKNSIQLKIHGKHYFAETSGSTGEPLVFYRDKEWDAWMRASLFRGYSWYGVNPWDRNGFLWGYNFSTMKKIKVKVLDELQNRFRLFTYDKKEIESFLKKLEKSVFISGYSSMIYELAKEINNRNLSGKYNLKLVMGASEKIHDGYQDEVVKAFGRKMVNEYGATEAGMIAFECPEGNMHVNMETNIVEEENKELVITNLTSKSFPIIRYKIGDYIEINNSIQCKCGRKHHVIKEILGRVGKTIYGYKNRYPSFTLYYIFKNIALNHNIILNYVAVQKTKGEIELYIEQKLNKSTLKILNLEYKKYFNDDLDMRLYDGKIYKQENRKKTDFVSFLDVSFTPSLDMSV
jgi:phenylacetate-CoA ligase